MFTWTWISSKTKKDLKSDWQFTKSHHILSKEGGGVQYVQLVNMSKGNNPCVMSLTQLWHLTIFCIVIEWSGNSLNVDVIFLTSLATCPVPASLRCMRWNVDDWVLKIKIFNMHFIYGELFIQHAQSRAITVIATICRLSIHVFGLTSTRLL